MFKECTKDTFVWFWYNGFNHIKSKTKQVKAYNEFCKLCKELNVWNPYAEEN